MANKIHMTPDLLQAVQDEIETSCQDAEKLADIYFPMTLDFSEKSIEAIEFSCDEVQYSMPGGKSSQNIQTLALCWGAYIGEVFRRNCGGHWEYWEDEYGKTKALVSPKNGTIFPINKIEKRLNKGKEENLVEYYKSMKELYF